MNAKLKIDLKQGIIEVEGTEEFVAQIYGDYKDRVVAAPPPTPTASSSKPAAVSLADQTSDEKKRVPNSRNRTGAPPSIVKDLDLSGRNGGQSLKDFCAPFAPNSAQAWNVLFLYYLNKNELATPVTQDHIYTCYKASGVKPPVAFSQSLFDTASKKGWLEPNALVDIKLTIAGENYVDHDFPKKEAAK